MEMEDLLDVCGDGFVECSHFDGLVGYWERGNGGGRFRYQ